MNKLGKGGVLSFDLEMKCNIGTEYYVKELPRPYFYYM